MPPVSDPINSLKLNEMVVLVVASNVRIPGLVGTMPVRATTLSVQLESAIRFRTFILTA